MNIYKQYYFFILVAGLLVSTHINAKDVIFPGKDNNIYINRLLKHALSYSVETQYNPIAYGKRLPRGREYKFLALDGVIDVIADGATRKREAEYLPIRFPILRGLNGWRIPLINKNNPDLFLKIKTLDELKKITALQFHTWSDTEILEHNGINVYKGGNQKGLYRMLDKNRVDYYPRSVLEIQKEYNAVKKLNIIIDPHIIIHYPAAFYFYVNKKDKLLAKDIKDGLEKSLKDGSFHTLFMEFFTDQLNLILKGDRHVFEFTNPLLSEETPLNRKELWINVPPRQ